MTNLYNIVLTLQNSDPTVLKRSQEALELFARDLEPYSFPADMNTRRKALASLSSRNETLPVQEIQDFLLHCFTNVEIVQSRAVAHFLWDPSEESTPSQSSMTAIDFILQPIENQQIYIPQHQQFFIDIRLEKGETLVWRYQIGCGQEVDFFVLFRQSMFKSLKSHPIITSQNTLDEEQEFDETGPEPGPESAHASEALPIPISTSSPSSIDRKLTESMNEFIKSKRHRIVETLPNESTLSPSHISIIVATMAKSPLGGWGRIPFLQSSQQISSTDISTPVTGCYQAQTKGGLCRLLWDNSISSVSGKHLEYCVQKVSEQTMQAALKAADDHSFSLSIPRSKSYIALLSCSSPLEVGVTVDGPFSTELLDTLENSYSISSNYLHDMTPGDHLRFVTERPGIPGSIEDNDEVVIPPTTPNPPPTSTTALSTHTNTPTTGSYFFNSIYSLPLASGALVSLGVTNGVTGLGIIGGLVKSIVTTPFVQPVRQPNPPPPEKTASSSTPMINSNEEKGSTDEMRIQERQPWMSSILTPYVTALWSVKKDSKIINELESEIPGIASTALTEMGMVKDLLSLAKRVDQLEDEVSLRTAERDQSRAQLDLLRQHYETEREELLKKQIQFEAEYSNLHQSLSQAGGVNANEDIDTLKTRVEQAEMLLKRSYTEAGVWCAAREVVEDRLAQLSSDQEVTRSALIKLENEKQNWIQSKLQWDEERRELCQRVAELERDKEELEEKSPSERENDHVTSNSLILSLMKERDELAQTVGDYVRRLDELQSEALLYRAQRRIDEREIKILRRECEEKILIAKSEVLESRMMVQQLHEKLSKLKGEKKLLVGELRALRNMGLYQGPLTRDGNEFGNSSSHSHSDQSTKMNPTHKEEDREMEEREVSSTSLSEQREEEKESQIDTLPFQVLLLELEERKRIIKSMLKADPESRSLQQLSLQLETQSQSLLQRVHTFSGSEAHTSSSSSSSSFGPHANTSLSLPSHEEWLQTSFQDWNSV